MKERGILFSAPMVRVNRAGIKTQMRRTAGLNKINESPDEWNFLFANADGNFVFQNRAPSNSCVFITCPYWRAEGDRLWTREAWRTTLASDELKPSSLPLGSPIYFEADCVDRASKQSFIGRLRPGMFMPRWASRNTLEVVSVRPERLHSITQEDIIAEGVTESLVRSVIGPVALQSKAKPEHWIGGYDQGFSFCLKCAEKKVLELKKETPDGKFYVDGGWATEGDSQSFCETCHWVLGNAFTTFACEQELDHFGPGSDDEGAWELSPLDCLSLENIIDSYGWTDSDRRDPKDLLAPKIRRLGWQALWESVNGHASWLNNPYVWRVEFRRLNA